MSRVRFFPVSPAFMRTVHSFFELNRSYAELLSALGFRSHRSTPSLRLVGEVIFVFQCSDQTNTMAIWMPLESVHVLGPGLSFQGEISVPEEQQLDCDVPFRYRVYTKVAALRIKRNAS
jgi:hypothetical protein